MKNPVCEVCGCEGNTSCGHEILDDERMCTLSLQGGLLICPCCVIADGAGHLKEPEDRRQLKLIREGE